MAKGDFGYDERIPEEIREVFAKLCDDVAFLQHAWNFYLSLFSKAENTQLMWDFAPASFQMIEEALRSYLTMAISRLSDPARLFGYDNLSFATLRRNARKLRVPPRWSRM